MSDVAIIWNEGKGDVLSRFARSLSNSTGWPIVRKPDPKAAINYFFLYIQLGQNPSAVEGLNKTASLFSHYEMEIPKKVAWWETARELVDIRTTWAAQYLERLLPYGESHIVTPPIDPQFTDYKNKKKPVIGVSGFVHPGHRKGEHLLKRLYQEKSSEYDIVASGVGWPVPNVKERKWEEMAAFYESLDVYLVTSLTEGIPMPPLEALAMNKKAVVPIGVGLLDEVDNPHIFRYEAGNYESMLGAIKAATATGQINVTDYFSEDAWAQSHKEAFGLAPIHVRGGLIKAGTPYVIHDGAMVDKFIPDEWVEAAQERAKTPDLSVPAKKPYSKPVLTSYGEKIPASGAVVVAYGKPARECAQLAISSWKKYMKGYPIALVSDEPLPILDDNELEDIFIHHADTDIGARSVKTQLYDIVPADWKNVLYLDADTEIVAPVPALFKWLEMGWDFLICTNPGLYASITQGARPDNREELEATIAEIGSGEFIQKNGGVFAFRRGDNAAAFMRGWHTEWLRWKGRDQFALLRALHKTPLKLLLLGGEWNTITRFLDPSITAGILHHPLRARRWAGVIYGPLDSKEAWNRVIE